MTARGLWLRLGALCASALLALALADPPRPHRPWPESIAAAAGVGAGLLLYLAAARRPPGRPRCALGTAAVIAACAGAEEVLWRWLAVGELAARAGPLAALALTSVAFGAAHRDRVAARAVAGASFGAVYLGSASLLAAWLAHAVYNLCAAAGAEAGP